MFKVYLAQNYGGSDGSVPMDRRYFSQEADAINHIKGKSDYGSDGIYWAFDVFEPNDSTPTAEIERKKQKVLSKLTEEEQKLLGLL